MKEYEVHLENSYSHHTVATFEEKEDAKSYMRMFNPPNKYYYFIIEVETKRTRISKKIFDK
mgnify:CR=1 FL=1